MPAQLDSRPRPFATARPAFAMARRVLAMARRVLRGVRFDAGAPPRFATLARIGIIGALAVAALAAGYGFGGDYTFGDLSIYHGAVASWANGDGGGLYDFVAPETATGFTRPAFTALAMLPMALLSPATAGYVNAAAALTVLTLLLAAVLDPIADRHGWPRWFATGTAVALAAATEPVRATLGHGQLDLLLAGLIVLDLTFLRWQARAGERTGTAGERTGPAGGRDGAADRRGAQLPGRRLGAAWRAGAFAGVGVGLATATALSPALFIGYFAVTRQWRAAVTATVTALAATTVAFVVATGDSVAFFGSVLWNAERLGDIGATGNQSLAGLLARLYDSADTPGLMWLAFAALLLAVGLSRARHAHTEGDELAAFTLVGLTMAVIVPVSATHRFIFAVPALVLLVDAGLRHRSARMALGIGRFQALAGLRSGLAALGFYAVLVVAPMWRYEHDLGAGVSHYADGIVGVLAENSLVLAGILVLALLPWRPGAEPAFPAQPGPPSPLRGS